MNWQAKSDKPMTLPTSWQQLPQGLRYCNAIRAYFSPWLTKILDEHILYIGGLSGELQFDLPLPHQILLQPDITADQFQPVFQSNYSHLQANPTALPFVQQSIGACFLINSLNFCADPHQVLREINCVITDDGYLFISLFNPFSPLIFKRYLHKTGQPKFAFRQYLTCRIIDWLQLLNFEVLAQQHLAKTQYSITALVAQKRTYPLSLQTDSDYFRTPRVLNPLEAFKQSI